ncbi:MAG: hypothetical protein JRD89_10505 [Deltaproteobacteria bacterium]|nr:hypothetical protein [Deltaproteobacteria bacterium]
MKVFEVGYDEKCGGCNWYVGKVYLMADTEDDASAIYGENERGLCGECLADMLAEEGYEIVPKGSVILGGRERAELSDGLDKLLDLEAKQDGKTLSDQQFALMEGVLRKLGSDESPH